ncbi:VOC family protein [Kitasatospora terrestris]|uniref:VOC domain-containing protein n=1 Tax=Kitasatospora terrestris TaxID=258051 RepID=A0ABP9DPT5_9ACTN
MTTELTREEARELTRENVRDQVSRHVTGMSSCLVVADLDRAAHWYRRVFGFETVSRLDIPERGERVAFLAAGPLRLELAERDGSAALHRADPPEHGFVQGPSHLAFYVDDLDAVLAELAGLGVPVAVGPVDIAPLALSVAFVRDIEGHLIEFVQSPGRS